jgi:hypothetical protein
MNEPSVHERLMRGEVVLVGRWLYRRCQTCGSIVRLNKPIIGDLHFCLTDEEIAARRSKSA